MWADPLYLAALAAALPAVAIIAGITPLQLALHWPGWTPIVLLILVTPVLEEIVFRAGLQDALATRGSYRLAGLTLANVLTALMFCLVHLFRHAPAWALATIVPALVFGWAYERHPRLVAPILLHALYNLAYLVLLSPA
ncbi:hypothetical protein GCM10028792_01000 [Salinisphaera aquimarina]